MLKKIVTRLVILLVLVGGIGGFYYYSSQSLKTDKNLYYGEIELDTHDIYSTVSGIIKEISVSEGDMINTNQEVIVLDSEKATFQYNQSVLSKSVAEENVIKSQTGYDDETLNIQNYTIKQLESQRAAINNTLSGAQALYDQSLLVSESLKTAYEQQETNYTRIKSLFDSGIETQVNLDNVALLLTNSKLSYDSSLYNSIKIESDMNNLRNQISAINSQIASAKEQLTKLSGGFEETDQTIIALQKDQATLDSDLSQWNLNQYKVKAYKGGIVESIYYDIGEFINIGSPLMTLYDPSQQYLNIYVSELDLLKLSEGKNLNFNLVTDKTFHIRGTIKSIAKKAMFTPVNIVTEEDRGRLVYKVEIEFNDETSIRAGMLMVTDFNELEQ